MTPISTTLPCRGPVNYINSPYFSPYRVRICPEYNYIGTSLDAIQSELGLFMDVWQNTFDILIRKAVETILGLSIA